MAAAGDEGVKLTLGVEIDAKYYEKGTKGSVHIFFARGHSLRAFRDGHAEVATGERAKVEMLSVSSMPVDTPVMVYWSTVRWVRGETHYDGRSPDLPEWAQMYRAFAGHARTTMGAVNEGEWCDLLDSDGARVGRIHVVVLAVKERSILLTDTKGEYLSIAEVTEATISEPTHTSITDEIEGWGTNISYLQPCAFTQIAQPVGRVPMWTFPLELSVSVWARERTPSELDDWSCLFRRLLDIAKLAMGLDGTAADERILALPIGDPLLTELLAHMILVFTRHMLYVRDSSKREGEDDTYTDEWMRVGHCRHPNRIAYDCEDGAAIAFELSLMFRRMESKDPILVHLQNNDRPMVPFFCIGTIRVGDGFTYHAFVLKLHERAYAAMRSDTVVDPAIPAPCLYETTCYSTSCWAFDYGKTEPIKRHARGYISEPIEPGICSPSTLAAKQGMYLHLCTAFVVGRDGAAEIARVDFKQDGRYGATLNDIMLRQSVRISAIQRAPNQWANAKVRYQCMPRMRPIRCGNVSKVPAISISGAPVAVPSTPPDYDLCYRWVDWTPALAAEISKRTNASVMIVYKIQPTHSFIGARVRVWRNKYEDDD